jgi:hypothetical protein
MSESMSRPANPPGGTDESWPNIHSIGYAQLRDTYAFWLQECANRRDRYNAESPNSPNNMSCFRDWMHSLKLIMKLTRRLYLVEAGNVGHYHLHRDHLECLSYHTLRARAQFWNEAYDWGTRNRTPRMYTTHQARYCGSININDPHIRDQYNTALLHQETIESRLAAAMATHPRLGGDSLLGLLEPETVRQVMDYVFPLLGHHESETA